MLHAYSRDDKYFRGRPDSLSSRRHYYGVRKPDGSLDNTAEELLANEVENNGLSVIRKLSDGGQISHRERSDLSVYMAIQFLRTPHMRNNIEQTHASLMDGVTRSLIKEKNAFTGSLAALRHIDIREAEKLARESAEAYLKGEIKVVVKPELSLLGMFQHCSTYAEFMSLCRWEVITVSDDIELITSDCPVHFRSDMHVALADPETIVDFPLTARKMLVMSYAESEERLRKKLRSIIPAKYLAGFVPWHNCVHYRKAADGDAEGFNRITASMCHEYIYCGDATDEFRPVLRAPSKNVRFTVTQHGDDFRLSLEAGKHRRLDRAITLNQKLRVRH